jgi:hypothetical protein
LRQRDEAAQAIGGRYVTSIRLLRSRACQDDRSQASIDRAGRPTVTADTEDPAVVSLAEERSRSRSRSRHPGAPVLEHTGRGGAGNVRPESLERDRAQAAQDKLDADAQRKYAAEQTAAGHVSHGRGGAGNIK